MDLASLFVVLALLVGETKEEVRRAVVACVNPQWIQGLEDITDGAILGVGLEMG